MFNTSDNIHVVSAVCVALLVYMYVCTEVDIPPERQRGLSIPQQPSQVRSNISS